MSKTLEQMDNGALLALVKDRAEAFTSLDNTLKGAQFIIQCVDLLESRQSFQNIRNEVV